MHFKSIKLYSFLLLSLLFISLAHSQSHKTYLENFLKHGFESEDPKCDNNCEIYENVLNGKKIGRLFDGQLSPFWAQEYTGVNLVRKEFEEINKDHNFKPVSTVISDSRFDLSSLDKIIINPNTNPAWDKKSKEIIPLKFHGNLCFNLLCGSYPIGAACNIYVADLETDLFCSNNLATFAEKMTKINPKLYVSSCTGMAGGIYLFFLAKILEESKTVNMLQDFEFSKRFSFLNPNTILVLAAGNISETQLKSLELQALLRAYTKKHMKKVLYKIQHNIDAIFASSLNPYGMVSDFALPTNKYTIAVPADNFVLSSIHSKTKDPYMFSGTSASAPQLAGALTYVFSVLPKLNLEETFLLLRKTAIATANTYPHFENKYGVGMLNAYKIFYVALKLYEAGFRDLSKEERIKILKDNKTYDFNMCFSEAQLKLWAKTALNKENKPEERKAALNNIQRMFLLTSSNTARKALIQIYMNENLYINAHFYLSMTLKGFSNILSEAAHSSFSNTGHTYIIHKTASFNAYALGKLGLTALLALYNDTNLKKIINDYIANLLLENKIKENDLIGFKGKQEVIKKYHKNILISLHTIYGHPSIKDLGFIFDDKEKTSFLMKQFIALHNAYNRLTDNEKKLFNKYFSILYLKQDKGWFLRDSDVWFKESNQELLNRLPINYRSKDKIFILIVEYDAADNDYADEEKIYNAIIKFLKEKEKL